MHTGGSSVYINFISVNLETGYMSSGLFLVRFCEIVPDIARSGAKDVTWRAKGSLHVWKPKLHLLQTQAPIEQIHAKV